MSTLNAALSIARTAISSLEKQISVTSHNIANASNPDYTRQRATVEALDPVFFGNAYFGTGVDVTGVERVYDGFTVAQIRDSNSSLSKFEARGSLAGTLEAALNDLGGQGVSAKLDAFFNSFQAVANSPSSYGERTQLISNAGALADNINRIDAQIRQSITQVNTEISSIVDRINAIAVRVRDLNTQIASAKGVGSEANDLKDKRDALMNELSGYIDFKAIETDSGSVDIFVGGGSYLVAAGRTSPLTVSNSTVGSADDVVSNGTVISGRINGGKLKGLFEGVATMKDAQTKLDMLAAALIKEVNAQHRLGFDLAGAAGDDLFGAHTVSRAASDSNTGGAVATSAVMLTPASMQYINYEIRFSSAAAYQIVDADANQVLYSGAYVSGANIDFDGIRAVITSVNGAPAAGDTFRVSALTNAATNLSVAITDPDKVAASSTAAGAPGNNLNALSIAALKDASTVGGVTFGAYYRGLVVDVANAVREGKDNVDAQTKIGDGLKALRESRSGVSMEEEAINLIRLQRSFEAAARVMSTVDSMYEALLNIR